MTKKKKLKVYGFNLTETIIWVGIVSIFAGIITFSSITFIQNAKVHAATQELNVYSAALLEYYNINGSFPSESDSLKALYDEGLIQLSKKKMDSSGENAFLDPWNTPYSYTVTEEGEGFILKSLGSDKKEGGTQRIARDIEVSSNSMKGGGGDEKEFKPGEVQNTQ